MIIAIKNGQKYELTCEDQDEVRLLTITYHGDLRRAIEQFHLKKFGEPLNKEPPPCVN